MADRARLRSSLSSALSSPWSCVCPTGTGSPPVGVVGDGEVRAEVETGGLPVRDRLVEVEAFRPGRRPSSMELKPSDARCSRTSCAMYSKKVSTNSGFPEKRDRSSGFCVAMPTGQVSRWTDTHHDAAADTTSGAVAKPNSSAPSSAATTTSRPVFSCPSTWTTMRSPQAVEHRVCCPRRDRAPTGLPACLSEVSGDAPVPPSRGPR